MIKAVLIVDVPAPYGEQLAHECRRRNVLPLACSAEEFADSGHSGFDLCVWYCSGSDEDLARLRAASKLYRDAALVIVSSRASAEFGFALRHLPVIEVVEIPCDPTDLAARVLAGAAATGDERSLGDFVGVSAQTEVLRGRIRTAARVNSKVLLQGETGTGKGVVARAIHSLSIRSDGPFIHVDCAALSPSLIESELFGHEKGAFTGAGAQRRGRFEAAAGGTIFLDEIGDLDGNLQTKLLRVLEDFTFERVGGTRSLPMEARVIAATSRDLLREVQTGAFRQDLYFRLSVLRLDIPPLRERVDDVPLLVREGLRRISKRIGVALPRVTQEFYAALGDHSWPGNVRELMNVLERLLVERRVDELRAEDLDEILEPGQEVWGTAAPVSATAVALDAGDEEPEMIRAALLETGGNVARAGRRLGLARSTLRYRIRRYGLAHLLPRD